MKIKELARLIEASGIEFRPDIVQTVKLNGTTTTVILVVENEHKFVGVAKCSDEDVFDKKIGYRIARARAENQLLGMVRTYINKERYRLNRIELDINGGQYENKHIMEGVQYSWNDTVITAKAIDTLTQEFKVGDIVETIKDGSHFLGIGARCEVLEVFADDRLDIRGEAMDDGIIITQNVGLSDIKLVPRAREVSE